MAETILIVVGIVFGLLFLAGLVIGVILLLRKLRDTSVPPNSPLVVNFVPSRSQGYAIGVQVSMNPSEFHNRVTEVIKPLDVPYDNDGNPLAKETVSFPMERSRRISLGRGVLSDHREIIFCLPERATDLPEKLREDTLFGRAMMLTTEFINVRDSAIMAVRAGDQARANIIKQLNTGELSEDLVSTVKDFYKEMVQKPVAKEIESSQKPLTIDVKK